jgi:hypothetical protein
MLPQRTTNQLVNSKSSWRLAFEGGKDDATDLFALTDKKHKAEALLHVPLYSLWRIKIQFFVWASH